MAAIPAPIAPRARLHASIQSRRFRSMSGQHWTHRPGKHLQSHCSSLEARWDSPGWRKRGVEMVGSRDSSGKTPSFSVKVRGRELALLIRVRLTRDADLRLHQHAAYPPMEMYPAVVATPSSPPRSRGRTKLLQAPVSGLLFVHSIER
jgi:hypothetical protein